VASAATATESGARDADNPSIVRDCRVKAIFRAGHGCAPLTLISVPRVTHVCYRARAPIRARSALDANEDAGQGTQRFCVTDLPGSGMVSVPCLILLPTVVGIRHDSETSEAWRTVRSDDSNRPLRSVDVRIISPANLVEIVPPAQTER
jgi:hypothetical protein